MPLVCSSPVHPNIHLVPSLYEEIDSLIGLDFLLLIHVIWVTNWMDLKRGAALDGYNVKPMGLSWEKSAQLNKGQ